MKIVLLDIIAPPMILAVEVYAHSNYSKATLVLTLLSVLAVSVLIYIAAKACAISRVINATKLTAKVIVFLLTLVHMLQPSALLASTFAVLLVIVVLTDFAQTLVSNV
jgi:hypothetical protein